MLVRAVSMEHEVGNGERERAWDPHFWSSYITVQLIYKAPLLPWVLEVLCHKFLIIRLGAS